MCLTVSRTYLWPHTALQVQAKSLLVVQRVSLPAFHRAELRAPWRVTALQYTHIPSSLFGSLRWDRVFPQAVSRQPFNAEGQVLILSRPIGDFFYEQSMAGTGFLWQPRLSIVSTLVSLPDSVSLQPALQQLLFCCKLMTTDTHSLHTHVYSKEANGSSQSQNCVLFYSVAKYLFHPKLWLVWVLFVDRSAVFITYPVAADLLWIFHRNLLPWSTQMKKHGLCLKWRHMTPEYLASILAYRSPEKLKSHRSI
jgi:hypothetical protein